MSAVILAFSEALRALSLAGDYLPIEKISSIVDEIAECYAKEFDLTDNRAFLDSFELLRSAVTSRPMSDEDELVVEIFAYNLSVMEENYGVDREAMEERLMRSIEEILGGEFANLVRLFIINARNK